MSRARRTHRLDGPLAQREAQLYVSGISSTTLDAYRPDAQLWEFLSEEIDMDTMARIHAVDNTTLTPLVRQARHSEGLKVIDWQMSPIHGGIGGGSGVSNVHRFTGSAREGEHIITWSLVLKILTETSSQSDTCHNIQLFGVPKKD